MLTEAVAIAGVPIEVVSAPEADAALGRLDGGTSFHALILDWNLPAVSGMEFLGVVRQRHPKLPVMILTGAPASVDLNGAIGLGAETVIAKPLTLDHWERLAHVLYGFCEDVRSSS